MEYKDGIAMYKMFESIHRVQLESSGIPIKFWLTLYNKLVKNVFDAGNTFTIFRIDYEEIEKKKEDPVYTVLVIKPDGIDANDSSQIYLIDHAWTYDCENAENDLMNIPGLLERMSNLMGLKLTGNNQIDIQNVFNEMWCYNQTYSPGFGSVENRLPVWYIMDELGSAIEHSNDANFRCVPFFYVFEQITYSLLFPIKNVETMGKVTRDYLEGPFGQNKNLRKCMMIPWQPTSFLDVNFEQMNSEEELLKSTNEILANEDHILALDKTKILKVYSEYNLINEFLVHPEFELVMSEEEADILWFSTHFKDYKKLRDEFPRKLMNQFPYESVLTIKNQMAVICRRQKINGKDPLTDNPPWFPTTYDLTNDLIKFVSCYQHREEEGLNNLWICKPVNLARGLNMTITDNLNCILRLSSSGPKLAQKYIDNPVLFLREDVGLVKFDVRYVILLKSVNPLKVYAYRNFFLRFANKPFELADFRNREKHYTVMNYQEGTSLYKILSHEFIEKFNLQNPSHRWCDIEKEIFKAFSKIFKSATSKPPPFGIGHNVQSRALYAIDLILAREMDRKDCDEEIVPKILEVNWSPDCERACRYYPTFFNDVFLLLFKDKYDESKFLLLD